MRDVPYRRARASRDKISRDKSSTSEFNVERHDGLGNVPHYERVDLVKGGAKSSARGQSVHSRKIDKYDFMKAEKLSLDQERYLEKILIHFAELITATLISQLRLRIQVKWENIDYVSYDVYTHSLVDPSALNTFTIEGFNMGGILFFEFPVCSSITDRLLGGKGQPGTEESRLTEIEEVVFCKLVQKLLLQFSDVFKEIKDLNLKMDKMECNPQAVQLYSPSEPMVISNFRVRIGDIPGDMKICLPLRLLKPLVPKLTAKELLPKSTMTGKEQKNVPSPFLIESAKIGIVVELGKSDILFQDLTNIGVGDVVRLDTSIENPLKVRIEGKTKFLGRPGVKEKKVALQICKIVQEGDEEFDE